MPQVVKIALAQALHTADTETLCRRAAEQGADLILFPEMFSNGYSRFDADNTAPRSAWIDAAEPLDGPYLDQFRKAAVAHGLAVIATFLEKADPKPFNSAVLIDRSGDTVLLQRKRHICFFDNPEVACAPGDASEVVTLKTKSGDVAIGVMICMDREFPDAASDLTRGGAEIILIPNSCPLMDDPDVSDIRVAGVRALAFQSVLGVAVANYPAPKDDGHSFAVNPLGKIIAMADHNEELLVVAFDLDEIRALQKQEWFRRAR